LLTLDASGVALGALPTVLVRYCWPDTHTKRGPEPAPESGRVLVAWSEIGGPVPDVEHVESIERACRDGHVDFERSRDVVAHASPRSLVAALRAATEADQPYTILHLLCHGVAIGDGFGVLVDGDGDGDARPVAVDAGRIRQLLAPFASGLRLVVLCACDSGNVGEAGNHLGSVAQALHRAGIVAVVASRYPLSATGSNTLTRCVYRGLLVDLVSLEQALINARTRLAEDTETFDWASIQLYARERDGEDSRPVVFRPYRGLLAFQAEHSRFFFGRDREIQETLDDLEDLYATGKPRFLVVAGASGTGKSSVVLAGVVPRLVAQGRMVAIFRPGEAPMEALEQALGQRTPRAERFVIVVDQFEEIFTHVCEPKARSRFIRRLWSLAKGPAGIAVIVTIRVDYIGRCGEVEVDAAGTRLDRVAYDEGHRVFVAQMDQEQLRAAIEAPAQRVGLALESGLAERVLADAGQEPGALPLSEYTLDRLWLARQGRVLPATVYEQLGGVIGALGSKADEIVAGFREPERCQARRLLTQLVRFGEDLDANTRKRRLLASLRPEAAAQREVFDRVVVALVSARLLVRSKGRGGDAMADNTTIEVAHEALIRKWELLRSWLKQDRYKLAELSKLAGWVAEFQTDQRLLSGAQLGYAREVVARYPDDIDPATRALVQTSQARERRNHLAFIIGSVITAGLGVVALIMWFFANDALDLATKSEKLAKSRETEARANEARAHASRKQALTRARDARDSGRMAGFLALQSRLEPASGLGLLREVETPSPMIKRFGWVRLAWLALGSPGLTRVLLGPEGEARYGPKGQVVLTYGNRQAGIWDATTGNQLATLAGHGKRITAGDFHPQATQVVTGSWDATARVWDAATGEQRTLLRHDDRVNAASFNSDGSKVLTASRDGTARIWDPDTGTVVQTMRHSKDVREARFLNESRVITRDSEEVRVWNALTGRQLFELGPASEFVVSSDSDHALTIGPSSGRVWNLRTGRKGVRIPQIIRAAQIDSAKQAVIAGAEDGTIQIWSLRTGERLGIFRGHSDRVLKMALSPDGLRVATFSADFTTRVWDPEGRNLGVIGGHAYSLSFHPNGRSLALGGHEPRVWDFERSAARVQFGHREDVVHTNFSGDRVVTVTKAGDVQVWNVAQGQLEHRYELGGPGVYGFLSPDGRKLVAGSPTRIWDTQTHQQLGSIAWNLSTAQFRHDSQQIVASEQSKIGVWSGLGRPIQVIDAGTFVSHVGFSADGRRVVAAIEGPKLVAWEVATGDHVPIGKMRAKVDGFSHDLRRYIDTSDNVVWIRETATGNALVNLGNRDEVLKNAVFSADSRRILATSENRSARIWDAENGYEVAVLLGHTGPVSAADFNREGDAVVTASGDRTAQVWEIGGEDAELRLLHRLWTATRVCPSMARRVDLLNLSEVEAKAEAERCETMIQCVYTHPDDLRHFEECWRAFTRAHELVVATADPS